MPRPTRVQEIVDAATSLFNERGFQGTSVRAIADAVGMQSGGLYTHFTSKEALLHHIVVETHKAQRAAIEKVQKSDLEPVAKFRAALLAHVSSNFEVGPAAAPRLFLTEWRHLTGPELEDVMTYRREYEGIWDSIVREAIDAGIFRKMLDTGAARMITLSVANWSVMWFDPSGRQSIDEIFGRMADEILEGFLAR